MDEDAAAAQAAHEAELIAKAKADAAAARGLLEAGDALGAIATVLVGGAELAVLLIEEDLGG